MRPVTVRANQSARSPSRLRATSYAPRFTAKTLHQPVDIESIRPSRTDDSQKAA